MVDGRTLSAEKSAESVARLRAALEQGDCSALLEGLRELVPEYVPSQAVLDETQ